MLLGAFLQCLITAILAIGCLTAAAEGYAGVSPAAAASETLAYQCKAVK